MTFCLPSVSRSLEKVSLDSSLVTVGGIVVNWQQSAMCNQHVRVVGKGVASQSLYSSVPLMILNLIALIVLGLGFWFR